MFQLLLLFTLVLVVFILKQTLFKRSRCRGNIPMAGKTVVITGELVWGERDQVQFTPMSPITLSPSGVTGVK